MCRKQGQGEAGSIKQWVLKWDIIVEAIFDLSNVSQPYDCRIVWCG